MNWNNVKSIFVREVRDQLRDRRTLFMIFVLPLLMYPLLGASIFQVSQFLREQPTRILMVGLPQLPEFPPLVQDDHFDSQWLDDENEARLLELTSQPLPDAEKSADKKESSPTEAAAKLAQSLIADGNKEAVVVFPADFAAQLQRFRDQLRNRNGPRNNIAAEQDKDSASLPVPKPQIFYNAANEKSQLAQTRLSKILGRWAAAVGKQNLKETNLPEDVAQPFEFVREDVSLAQQRTAALWSKLLPFVLLLWALTGAFYPAIDLCAGEKERGTLETLLCSPAQRSEIVAGKLLTVMLFSIATSVLNLACMGVTGGLVISNLPGGDAASRIGMPPVLAQVWLLVALVPVSALFGALCVALATFARSSKEGQYYLMPLILITLPLVILPMGPGMELNLGNSLIPLTGLVLLLKVLLEGNYLAALPYVAPVVFVTLLCCLLAVRWAVEQFNRESVLFRESERWDFGLWMKHLRRDRGNTPSVSEAIFCGVLILLIRFFMGFSMHAPASFGDFCTQTVVTQLVMFATPALIMAIMLTRSPRQTLLLRRPAWWTIPAAAVLAIALQPTLKLLELVVSHLYPVAPEMIKTLTSLNLSGSLWLSLVVMAIVPAICEELAFRGFILSGFRHLGHKWWAIVLTSVLFGITHTILQQSIVAGMIGVVIGYVAVQTGSIFPGMVFHFTSNALVLMMDHWQNAEAFKRFIQPIGDGQDFIYSWWILAAGILITLPLLFKFAGLNYRQTKEERLQEAIQRQAASVGA